MAYVSTQKFTLSIASECDRHEIYRIRHRVYAEELQQHPVNGQKQLRDNLDLNNHYIVAKQGEYISGFISITPPTSTCYSVDKYFSRSSIPFGFDDDLYEVRLLTVIEQKRKSFLALALMYASFRWVQSHGGKYIVSICRSDLIDMYKKAGLLPLNQKAVSGKITYDLCVAEVENLNLNVQLNFSVYDAFRSRINWQLPYSFFAPSACFHGGAFFKAIGEDLQDLQKAKCIINADVLDAWFPPSPKVLEVLSCHLSWLLQTSPPTHASGFIDVVAEVRGISKQCILHGAGSSDLIFLSFKALLNEFSKVLIIDPCYGEYIHVLRNVVKCQVHRFILERENGFRIDTTALLAEIQNGYDMVVLVNPNSPTGVHVSRIEMEAMLQHIPPSTLVWIDETYIEYVGSGESLEQVAARAENVMICKSMSKVYALSGARAAYLCCSPHLIETLKTLTPPWAISLPAQAAAIMALKDGPYYQAKYAQTHLLRKKMKIMLKDLGITDIVEGVANFLLFYLPADICPHLFLQSCREENLFLRDVSNMGTGLGNSAIRIAIKDEETNNKMILIIKRALTLLKEQKE